MNIKAVADAWDWAREYLGIARRGRRVAIADIAGLKQFLATRASHVAQTSLYGYMRTRAGTRYMELFQSDTFITALNIAKWQIWLACLSDLAVYAGGVMSRQGNVPADRVAGVIKTAVEAALAELGTPPDAGDGFAVGVERLRLRLGKTDWTAVTDDEQPFRESPAALVEWAPIVDELKQFDAEIVMNSVRFRWKEVRRDLRRALDAAALAAQPC